MMHKASGIGDDIDLAEASAWLARLHGPRRSVAVEAAFRTWLAENPAHAAAYARVADIWDVIPGAARLEERIGPSAAPRRPQRRAWLAAAAAVCMTVGVALGLAWLLWRPVVYQTAAGEVESITLRDGTFITLNTNTRLRVDYSRHARRIQLERGEAIFEDVTDPRRPFIVQAGVHQVRALGTTFQVRVDRQSLAVTLMEGKVAVSRSAPVRGQAKPDIPTILSPGERLVVQADGHAILDHPSLEALTAWRRGEVVFDNITLARAIDEINRYGGTPVHLGDPTLATLRVSGVFTVHDPAEFARALAKLQHLRVVRSGQDITIVR